MIGWLDGQIRLDGTIGKIVLYNDLNLVSLYEDCWVYNRKKINIGHAVYLIRPFIANSEETTCGVPWKYCKHTFFILGVTVADKNSMVGLLLEYDHIYKVLALEWQTWFLSQNID